MKLQEIVGYLPYGLKGFADNKKIDIIGINTLDACYTVGHNTDCGYTSYSIKMSDCKPILRPLSDMTKSITVKGYNDGKPFVPIIKLFEMYPKMKSIKDHKKYIEYAKTKDSETGYYLELDLIDRDEEIYWFGYNKELQSFDKSTCLGIVRKNKVRKNCIPTRNQLNDMNHLKLYEMLYRWHFDIYGLIDNFEAVEINRGDDE